MAIRGLVSPCRASALGLLLLVGSNCGTAAPAAPAATPAATIAAAPPPPAVVVPPAPVALEFASPASAKSALVGSLVAVAPAKLVGDLDALSKRLELPMRLGQELLSSVGGLGLLGDRAHFQAVWDRLDPAASLAVVWVLPPQAAAKGFCLALTFRDAEGARKTFDELGTAGAQRNGASERRAPSGDVLWGGTRGRTLFVSNSSEALLLAGGLAEAAQAAPTTGQVVATVLPPALVAASGKSREAVLAEVATVLANEARNNKALPTPALQRLVAALTETAAKVALDSSAVRLALEAGPNEGFWLRTEMVPANGTDFAATMARRAPHAFDAKLPVRDDSTGVLAFGNPSDWLSILTKVFEMGGPTAQEMWKSTTKLFASTGPWSCTIDPADAGFAGLCSAPLTSGTSAKVALDAVVAMLKAQHRWEGELYGQKLASLKIKRAGQVVEIEKKIENRDRVAQSLTKAFAGGDTMRTAFTVKGGHLLQATGRDARKTLARYGAGGVGKAPLLTEALARHKGAELLASLDVISMVLRVIGKNKDLPGSSLASVAAALPGMAEMKAPFLFTLRGGATMTGEFRISLGSLDSVAKVMRGMVSPAGASPAR
jgi:hypothetical protein